MLDLQIVMVLSVATFWCGMICVGFQYDYGDRRMGLGVRVDEASASCVQSAATPLASKTNSPSSVDALPPAYNEIFRAN